VKVSFATPATTGGQQETVYASIQIVDGETQVVKMTARWLIHVLDAQGHFNPEVHVFFVHGEV